MPIYAYCCEACGFKKDALQKLADAPLTECPSCGQARFVKQVTAAGFQLKGSGWYVTDFRSAGAGNSAASNKPNEASSNGNGDSSTSAGAAAAPAASSPSPTGPAPVKNQQGQ